MAVPDFQTIMLPFLQFAGDGNVHSIKETLSSLAAHFQLSNDELTERIPSGLQTTFYNRVTWAQSYLRKALLIETTKRGYYQITERGRQLLRQNLERIDMNVLAQFPEYLEFKAARRTPKLILVNETLPVEIDETPDDLLDESFQTIRETLADEILVTVKSCSPDFFEKLVVDLLVKMGYGGSLKDAAASLTRKTGDEGIDGIINEDRLGLDSIYVQAKRWEGSVSRPEIQKFAGALQGKRAKKGVFLTTSNFTKEAKEFAAIIDSKIILINGRELAELMIDYNVGVSVEKVYEIKKIDSDYFVEE